MKQQPVALQFAYMLEDESFEHLPVSLSNIAAELRRLHQSETEGWRYADELEQERKKHKLQVLQLIDAIEDLMYWDNGKPEWEDARNLIKEIQEKNDV